VKSVGENPEKCENVVKNPEKCENTTTFTRCGEWCGEKS
jgi:hypothetical protein